MWQRSWIYPRTLASSFSSMSKLACWFLLKKDNWVHKLVLSMYISRNNSKKRGKHMRRGLFCESSGITCHRLLNVKYSKGPLLEIIRRYIYGIEGISTPPFFNVKNLYETWRRLFRILATLLSSVITLPNSKAPRNDFRC